MPFFEIKHDFFGLEVRELNPGSKVQGKINKKLVQVEILNVETLLRDEISLTTESAGLVFDKEGKVMGSQRTIVYLVESAARNLRINNKLASKDRISPGAFQDTLTSLERLARIQAGDLKAKKWGFGRTALAVLSAGATEHYTADTDDL